MSVEFVEIIYFLMWYFLIAFAFLYFIFGVDELFFDIYYWHYVWKNRKKPPLIYEKIIAVEEQSIAILIPCWQEANVIGKMLTYNLRTIDYKKYHFFIGLYPNDHDTIAEVTKIAQQFDNVHYVIGQSPGPTNKASNLNIIYDFIKAFEVSFNKSFDLFVLHDSEDIIHPMSFKLYNYLIPEQDMVQIPVFPLAVNLWNFTHWLYAEEFSENHTKNIIVRQAISGHVPSAGVGTAFSRSVLQHLENPMTKGPFSVDSLTEDYRVSLMIHVRQFKQLFVTQHLIRMQWQKRRFFRKGYQLKPSKEIIATRAFFPSQYKQSVRQKARWIIGIVFQEWQDTKWPKGWKLRYILARDRKSSITYILDSLSYLIFLFWVVYSVLIANYPEYPSLYEQFHQHVLCWWLIFVNLFLMIERIIQRIIAVLRIYGWPPVILSIPRAIYGNLLNLHALFRAYRIYYLSSKNKTVKTPLPWDKTSHSFPSDNILRPYQQRDLALLVQELKDKLKKR